MNVIERILQIIASHECLQCATEGHLLCGHCAAMLPSVQPSADDSGTTVYAATSYEGIAKDLVHMLKFERAAAAAQDMAAVMALRFPAVPYDAIVYVPTAAKRVRQRGYDQAALLAKQVASQTQLPCLRLLVRVGAERQVGAIRAARLTQLQSAFRMKLGRTLDHQRLLLIDDVITTGSTIRAAAGVLVTAGAAQVDALAFARA